MKGLLFTYALSYGGALVSLVNPFIGLLVYVCFAILKPEALWSWSLPEGGHFSRIVAVALLMGWAFKGFGRWQIGRARGLVAAFVGLWVWGWAAHVLGPSVVGRFPPLIPVTGTLLAIPVLGEIPSSLQLAGIVLIIGGLFVASGRRPSRQPHHEQVPAD